MNNGEANKFSEIEFKFRYSVRTNKFVFWSPNCSTVLKYTYDNVDYDAILNDVLTDLRKQYFLTNTDVYTIEEKIRSAIREICTRPQDDPHWLLDTKPEATRHGSEGADSLRERFSNLLQRHRMRWL